MLNSLRMLLSTLAKSVRATVEVVFRWCASASTSTVGCQQQQVCISVAFVRLLVVQYRSGRTFISCGFAIADAVRS